VLFRSNINNYYNRYIEGDEEDKDLLEKMLQESRRKFRENQRERREIIQMSKQDFSVPKGGKTRKNRKSRKPQRM